MTGIKVLRGSYVINRGTMGENGQTFSGYDYRFLLGLGRWFELSIEVRLPFREKKL